MAEQNLVAVAAGLARTGTVPFATTYGVFASRRAYDFIAIACAHSMVNVKIVAGLPGLTTGYGGTHQAIEDTGADAHDPEPRRDRSLRRDRHRAGHRGDRRLPRTGLHAPAARQGSARPRPRRAIASRSARRIVLRDGGDVGIVATGSDDRAGARRRGCARRRGHFRRRAARPDAQAVRPRSGRAISRRATARS